MTIQFQCQCGKKFAVADALAGKSAKCSACGAQLTIPAAEEDEASFDLTPLPSPAAQSAAPAARPADLLSDPLSAALTEPAAPQPVNWGHQKPKVRNQVTLAQAVLIGVGAGAALLAIAGVLFLLLRGSGSPAPATPAGQVPVAQTSTPASGTVPPVVPPAVNPTVTQPVTIPVAVPIPTTVVPIPTATGAEGETATATAVFVPQLMSPDPGTQPAPKEQSPAPTLWQLQVDPPAVPVDSHLGRTFSVKLPGDRDDILFPVVPSNLVALGNNNLKTSVREVWDTAANVKKGGFSGFRIYRMKSATLSPDGEHLAGLSELTLGIWSSKSDRQISDIPAKDLRGVAFIAPGKLAVWSENDLAVLQIPGGKKLQELLGALARPKLGSQPVPTFSAGGRYAAIPRDAVEIYDLGTAELVGSIPLKNVQHLAFSPDGTELAIASSGSRGLLHVYDLAQGQPLFTHSLGSTLYLKGFVWVPDGSGWLVDHYKLYDRKVGGPVWEFKRPENNIHPLRRPVNRGRALEVNWATNTLTSVEMPQDLIERGVQVVSEGGSLQDAKLPLPQETDIAQAVPRPLTPAPWTATPDPAPAATRPLVGQIALDERRTILREMFVSRADAGIAAARVETGPTSEGPTTSVDVFDLSTGKVKSRIDLATAGQLVALSPDGQLLALRSDRGRRIDIFATNGERLVGLFPYAKFPTERADHETKVVGCLLVGQHLLTMSNQGLLVLWELPICRAVYARQFSTVNPKEQLFALSPHGRDLLVAEGTKLHLLETLTGESRGTVEAPPQASFSFHSSGQRLAVVGVVGDRTECSLWDVNNGRRLKEFTVPWRWVDWCGDYLLLGKKFLVEPNAGRVAWSYRAQLDSLVLNVGLVLYRSRAGVQSLLRLVAVPNQEVLGKLAGGVPDTKLLPSGSSVSIQFRLTFTPSPADTAEITQRLEAQLKARGVQVTADAPQQLVVFSRLTTSDQTMQVGPQGGGAPAVAVGITELHCGLTLKSGEEAIWSGAHRSISNNSFVTLRIEQGENVGNAVAKYQSDEALKHLKQVTLPEVLQPFKAAWGLGESVLD